MENPLFKKKISCNGDSICEGVGYLGGYAKIIAERNDMEYQNIGIGGGGVSPNVFDTKGNPRYCISEGVKNMDADADYAIVEGGVNDATHFEINGFPKLGELTSGYSGPFDKSTFIGAFEFMLKELTVRFAGKKVGYIAVHQCSRYFRPPVAVGEENNFYIAAKECCEKWGVPYLDLTVTVPPVSYLRTKLGADPSLDPVSEISTHKNDGCHPNKFGYENFYCDKIEAWLKTL